MDRAKPEFAHVFLASEPKDLKTEFGNEYLALELRSFSSAMAEPIRKLSTLVNETNAMYKAMRAVHTVDASLT